MDWLHKNKGCNQPCLIVQDSYYPYPCLISLSLEGGGKVKVKVKVVPVLN